MLSFGRRRRDEDGSVAVEFALIVPLLVMLILGTVTTGVAFSRSIGVSNAVREGARFGATADATNGSTWSSNTIDSVRQTQFDDGNTVSTSHTSVCVQLWRVGDVAMAATALVSTNCSVPSGAPALTLPATASSAPPIPASAPAGSCWVRVIAARPYSIGIGVTVWNSTFIADSVSRYQRIDKVTTCM